jgi:hypothetical protein
MSYDETKDPARNAVWNPNAPGTKSRAVTPSDTTDLDPYPLRVVVTEAGDLVCLPVMNSDSDTVTFVEAPVGFIPPFRVRRVLEDSTASVATID